VRGVSLEGPERANGDRAVPMPLKQKPFGSKGGKSPRNLRGAPDRDPRKWNQRGITVKVCKRAAQAGGERNECWGLRRNARERRNF